MANDYNYRAYHTTLKDANNKEVYYGTTRYSAEQMRRQRKRKYRLIRQQITSIFAAGTILISLPVGSYFLYKDIRYFEGDGKPENVQTVKNQIAFTNYSNKEVDHLPYEEKISLYKSFIEYVEQNVPPVNIPTANDYHQQKAEADNAAVEVALYEGTINDESLEELKRKVLKKYQNAIETIRILYHEHYVLNSDNPNVEIIQNVQDNINRL